MLRIALAVVVTLGSVIAGVGGPQVSAAEPPQHAVAVVGSGVGMYPTFDEEIARYAVTTTAGTEGTVTLHASTTDPAGSVRVNGRRIEAATTVDGLEAGDEISVLITDAAGKAAYSLVYLPAGFPTLSAPVKEPGIAPGLVGITISQWREPTPNFEAAVDVNGVPVHVRARTGSTLDLKQQPNGRYSVSLAPGSAGRTGSALVEYDAAFNEVRRHETVGLQDTDGHDSILRADGSRVLVAYEPNDETKLVDAVVQDIDPRGEVVFEWRSDQLVDETVVDTGKNKDYAHINSVFEMLDGDLLVSLRHTSSVLKIARTAHDGFRPGDIVWRLGGRRSDFSFVGDDHPGGPCAQHTASELPDGNILIFDNGSGWPAPAMCIDPADRSGAPVPRPLSRVTEYDLGEVDTDPATPETAKLVWSYAPEGRYSFFAGSAQRLANGNTLVGWATVRAAFATEVDPAGKVLWDLKDTVAESDTMYSTYRALKFDVPDTVPPAVVVGHPLDGATFQPGERVTVDLECTDRGGSTLQSCQSSAPHGAALDTSTEGRFSFEVNATDGAGNTTTVTRGYTVAGPPTPEPPSAGYRPDTAIRAPRQPWVGDDVYGGALRQRVMRTIPRTGRSATWVVRVQNDGNVPERMRLVGTAGDRRFRVTYLSGGTDVTRRMGAGRHRTRVLDPGSGVRLQVRVVRTQAARPGDRRRFVVRAASAHRPATADAVAAVARATR